MEERVRQHVEKHCREQGWSTDINTIIEEITESPQIYREEYRQFRWWTEYQYVVEIDGMLIGYVDAEATGDSSPREMGYKFDPSSIREMVAVEKTITVYEPAS